MPKRRRKPRNADASDASGEDNVVLRETLPLQLRYYGDPVLRKKAEPITEITEAELQIAEQMLETLYTTGTGIGLAATQVGILKRLIIVDIGEDDDEEYEPLALFNPEILSFEGEIVAEEGCLSIPDVTADVKRPEQIVVEGINVQREPIRIEADGLLARVLQHEIDHLNGILFIDRINGLKRRLLSDELLRVQQAQRPS
ncbi:Peptide deformylase [Geodia barretti]|jgi:peptide deformylase|uniref:Peptide deformylase n=1 Tax=Geodia barretti TaxID=519541 RepID=A0AA35XKA6_GEOBA|nr:Peptide deformylase [Geodia barretti]